MSGTNKLYIKVLALLLDVGLYAIKIGKQIILPNRKRKGNLLSSLFVFFIGIIERLHFFEHGLFSMTAVFRKKYVKRTIFIIGFILFLLSLFEWTNDRRNSNSIAIKSTDRLSSPRKEEITIAKQTQVVLATGKANISYQPLAFNTTHYSPPTFFTRKKKFLLYRILRV